MRIRFGHVSRNITSLDRRSPIGVVIPVSVVLDRTQSQGKALQGQVRTLKNELKLEGVAYGC